MGRSVRAKARAKARRGAALLDERMPGWWRSIRTTRLRMERGAVPVQPDGSPLRADWCGCVGVQISMTHKRVRVDESCASWWDTMQALGIETNAQAEMCGFALPLDEVLEEEAESAAWAALDEVWLDEVRARRREARA